MQATDPLTQAPGAHSCTASDAEKRQEASPTPKPPTAKRQATSRRAKAETRQGTAAAKPATTTTQKATAVGRLY